jgi:hypothetical protein
MPKTPCRDAFKKAAKSRTAYPLPFGAYKLREVRDHIKRMQDTLWTIKGFLKNPKTGYAVGPCCTSYDTDEWIRSGPVTVADILGYCILPAIAAMTGDGISKADVAEELSTATARAQNILKKCERQHIRLGSKIASEYNMMKKGDSEVWGLLSDADMIARRALELVEWVEMKANLAKSVAEPSVWDVDDLPISAP